MKIDLYDTKEFIEINGLQEVTSAVLFQRGDVPHPDGLISNEIFGITTKSRKETFAYIDLHGYYFHPHIYKVIKRLFRNIEKIINGEMYYSIDKHGKLIPDENGETGLDFIYNNWEKIKWEYSPEGGMRNERIDLLTKTPKNVIFTRYQIVEPAFYRDIKNSKSGGGETEDINKMYGKLIRLATLVRDKDMFDFQFCSTNYNIQNTMVDVYNYYKTKLEKKNGLFRKYLLGRNVDYCTRTVITSPNFHANLPEDMMIDFRHSGVPIAQVCSLCYPFIVRWVKQFFERELFDNQNGKILYDPVNDTIDGAVKIVNPQSYFSEKYIKKMIDGFIKDPECRFDKIEVPSTSKRKLYLRFNGRRMDTSNQSEISSLAFRPMTLTDLLYMACDDTVKDKHSLVTRYPLLDDFGIFIARIRVLSTTKTDVVSFNGKVYKWYPHIEFDVPGEQIATKFIDSVQFSNSYLPGLDGDYDGDQTTIKIIWSQEANDECEAAMNKKSYFINSSGKNIRYMESEVIQTFYTMTKEPNAKSKTLTPDDKKYFLSLKPNDCNFENLVKWLGNVTDAEGGREIKVAKSHFNCNDKMHLTHAEYPLVQGEIDTTLGRFLYTKIIVEGCGLENILGYINYVLDDDGHGKLEGLVTRGVTEDGITVQQMYKYTDTRDWLGLQLHSVITTSFTLSSIVLPPEVRKLKKELLAKYKTELENADPVISEKIEKALIAKTKEVLKDDVGLDLYISGARGSIGNNYKNINLIRGAVKNTSTGKYEIIESSLMEGLNKKDMTAHSNTILAGAYPKAVGTALSGYLSKELISALQTEVLGDPESDCGTLGYLSITLPVGMKKLSNFFYRYIIEGSKFTLLTPDNIEKYGGKTVKLRSPMYCIGVGKERCLCNKCAGNFFYMIGKKDIGLLCSKPAETTKRLGMKKFHVNLVVNKQFDINDMLM